MRPGLARCWNRASGACIISLRCGGVDRSQDRPTSARKITARLRTCVEMRGDSCCQIGAKLTLGGPVKSKNFLRRNNSATGNLIHSVKPGRSIVEIISGLIGFSVVLIYLYGYGVAIGIANNLNADHSMLIGSPFDLFIFCKKVI